MSIVKIITHKECSAISLKLPQTGSGVQTPSVSRTQCSPALVTRTGDTGLYRNKISSCNPRRRRPQPQLRPHPHLTTQTISRHDTMAGLDLARFQTAWAGLQKRMWMGAVPIKKFNAPVCTSIEGFGGASLWRLVASVGITREPMGCDGRTNVQMLTSVLSPSSQILFAVVLCRYVDITMGGLSILGNCPRNGV